MLLAVAISSLYANLYNIVHRISLVYMLRRVSARIDRQAVGH